MQELTLGSPQKAIFRFALPIFIGNILQQAYQMADNIIVGQFVGANAFAAVGSTYGIFFLITGLIWGTTVGFTVPIAQKYGEGDFSQMRKMIGTSIWLSIIISVSMTIITVAIMPWLLRFMNTPEEIYAEAYSYIIIICAGLFAQILYNLLACILRAIGNSRIPLYFLILSAALNIILDFVFILPFKMGTGGAALATVISQAISGFLCLIYIIKKVKILHLCKDELTFNRELAKEELLIGLPMALQYVITSIGMLVIQTSLNLLGTEAVTAYSAGNKIEVILEQGPIAIGSTMATYTAQNWGAQKYKRISQGVKASFQIMIAYFLIFGTLTAFYGKELTYLFISDSTAAILTNVDLFLKIISSTGILLGILCIFRNCVQGMGFASISLIGGVVELIARTIVSLITMHYKTFGGICLGYPAAWLFASLFFIAIYCNIKRKNF